MTDPDWALERQPRAEPKCDHATCTACTTCACHRKPKNATPSITPVEAKAEAARLCNLARNAIRTLDALTSVTKTRPRSQLEEAIIRGHADHDNAMRSPTLNGAVSGGDDPSFRILDGLLDRKTGNPRTHADDIAHTLTELVATIERLAHDAAQASGATTDLRAISSIAAETILRDESDIQSCVNPHCGKVVTGTRDDRLRAGRCKPCFDYRLEHDGADRPKRLIDLETARETTHAT